MKSIKGEQGKQCLIEIALKLFLKKGYSNTGINEILQQANMSKGSFYFSSKKELGIEVEKYYGKTLLINWLEPLSDNSWDIFVCKMVSNIKRSASGLEIAFIEDNLLEAYATAIIKLINIFLKSLQVSGLAKNKVYIVAKKAFGLYEGHILYYRICKDESAFDCILNDLLSLV